MAGVQVENGQFRIYYQGKDYKIYEMQLDDPDSTRHKLLGLSGSIPAARINTPIAACAWDDLRQIRVYYLTETSEVQEILYSWPGGWAKGATLPGIAVENSTCLYAQVRTGSSPAAATLRVGFQSAKAPQTITEAYYVSGKGWKTRVF